MSQILNFVRCLGKLFSSCNLLITDDEGFVKESEFEEDYADYSHINFEIRVHSKNLIQKIIKIDILISDNFWKAENVLSDTLVLNDDYLNILSKKGYYIVVTHSDFSKL